MPHRDLDEWSRDLSGCLDRVRVHRINETELREDANPVIIAAAADLYGLSDLGATAERRPGRRRGQLRRYDKLYWGVVVEWEWTLASDGDRDHAAEQALAYLAQVRAESGDAEAFTCVVSNGKDWGFLTVGDDDEMDLFGQAYAIAPRTRFEWRSNNSAACRRFLELIGSHRQQPVTAAGLATSFGPGSAIARTIVTLLAEGLSSRRTDDRADTLYREWRRSLDVVYGDLDAQDGGLAGNIHTTFDMSSPAPLGELLFVIHTYFGLVARLLAIEVLALSAREADSQPTGWGSLSDDELIARLEGIDSGAIPRTLTVNNLFEADVFSWYRDALRGNVDLLNAVRDLLRTLGSFALPRVAYGANHATDILRELYQSLVPRALRKALGEFLTPPWLAEACISRLRALSARVETGRVLDPTCGTGTFLVPILRERVRRLRSGDAESLVAADVQRVLDNVVGIDINPVAVTAARVNYVTALGDLLNRGTLTLPIWRADSILLPDSPPMQGELNEGRLANRPWRRLKTSLPKPFPIPPALADAPRMAILRRLLEGAMAEPDAAASEAEFVSTLRAAFSPDTAGDLAVSEHEWADAQEVALELHDRLRELRDANRNGVWARIIENSFAPIFAGRFDVVLGNPPWLTWTRMPSEWRSATMPVWMRYGLWRVPPRSGRRASSLASTDVATLVFAIALERYATDDAYVGLLMPRSVITADPGNRAFRRFRLKTEGRDTAEAGRVVDLSFAPEHLDDWSTVKPFSPDAANSPVFLVSRVNGAYTGQAIPTVRWERLAVRGRLIGAWSHVTAALHGVDGESRPVDPGDPSSAWSFQIAGAPALLVGGSNPWSFGKGLDTRGANGIFFLGLVRASARGNVVIENHPAHGRLVVPTARGEVESALVYPLLRGRDVSRWSAIPSGYIIVPHDPARLGSVLTDSQLLARFPNGRRWLRRFSAVLKDRRVPPTRSWHMAGEDWCRLDGPLSHMSGRYIVVIREQDARPAAAVVGHRYDATLGRTSPVMIDHKLVFSAVSSEDEAYYLAGMMNCTPIQDLLASYANVIAISHQTLSVLPIPPFDATSATAAAVGAASRAAHEAARAGALTDSHQAEVDRVAAALLALPATYRPQPHPVRRPRRRAESPGTTAELSLFDTPLTGE